MRSGKSELLLAGGSGTSRKRVVDWNGEVCKLKCSEKSKGILPRTTKTSRLPGYPLPIARGARE
jgi:hypothetical protein